jgi:hypothetical protein
MDARRRGNLQKLDTVTLWPGRIAVAFGLLATAGTFGLSLSGCAPEPNEPRFWMRSEAYQAAAEVALARSDIDRNDPSLIARDFTRHIAQNEDGGPVIDNYTPCTLKASELIGADMMRKCSLSPGVGGLEREYVRCPWQTCVIVSVRSETWADPIARQVILSTLADFDKICSAARAYGPNKRFDATAAGCDRPERRERVRLAVEVKPRLFQPCVYRDVRRVAENAITYRPICANRDATLIALD